MLRNELRRKVEEVETNADPDTDKEKLPTRDVAKARERQEWALNNLDIAIVVASSKQDLLTCVLLPPSFDLGESFPQLRTID
jgi:hypothetical protein